MFKRLLVAGLLLAPLGSVTAHAREWYQLRADASCMSTKSITPQMFMELSATQGDPMSPSKIDTPHGIAILFTGENSGTAFFSSVDDCKFFAEKAVSAGVLVGTDDLK